MTRKSRFITYLSLFSIAASVYMIIESISNLVILNSLQSSPEYKIVEQMIPSMSVSPSETLFEIFLQVAGIIASIGMFNRLHWGRVMYIVVLSAVTIFGVITSTISYLSLSKYLNAFGTGDSLSLLFAGNILALGITAYLVWKLSTKEIQKEFMRQADVDKNHAGD